VLEIGYISNYDPWNEASSLTLHRPGPVGFMVPCLSENFQLEEVFPPGFMSETVRYAGVTVSDADNCTTPSDREYRFRVLKYTPLFNDDLVIYVAVGSHRSGVWTKVILDECGESWSRNLPPGITTYISGEAPRITVKDVWSDLDSTIMTEEQASSTNTTNSSFGAVTASIEPVKTFCDHGTHELHLSLS
jgi:hypothetical protein